MKPAVFSRREALILAAVIALGLGLRLAVALRAPWFWDEGYMVEAAQSVAHAHRPQVSGLWEDGFFPLSTSVLAPLSAAPLLALVPGPDAMTAARVWAVLLEGLVLLLLARLGLRLGGPALGLAAAGLYALMPYAVEHGGRCFYHHLAVVFLMAALADGLDLFQEARPASLIRASLWSGLAAAGAYWLWWLPLLWGALLIWRRPRAWGKALLWAAAAPLGILVVNVAPDPAGAWWSIRSLLGASTTDSPKGLGALIQAAAADLGRLPFLTAGLLGMGAAAWSARRGAWVWLATLTALLVLEPIRQRGDISGISYPFQMAAPLAALGAAWLCLEALRAGAWLPRICSVAVLALALWPVKMGWMRMLSFDPAPVEQMSAYFDAHARPGDGVCGMPEFNWRLGPRMRVCDPFAVGAAEQRAAGFYLAGAPASRLAWACELRNVRYAVLSRIDVLSAFRTVGVPLTFLEVERQGWPKVFDNGTFRVYENPGFGAAPRFGQTLLSSPEFYRYAATDAARAGRPDDEAYALARAKALDAQAR
jgi:hypothetical protein